MLAILDTRLISDSDINSTPVLSQCWRVAETANNGKLRSACSSVRNWSSQAL